MIVPEDVNRLYARCKQLRPAKGMYLVDDYISNLLLTVLDFQLHENVIGNAMRHYESRLAQTTRTFEDLKRLLSSYPNDREGNTALAMHMWGYRYWNRIELLRNLTGYFESAGVTSQDALREWANTATFQHFQGKVPGMGYAIYQWLVMRQGVETIKPDIHLRRFVASTIGHGQFTDEELVHTLESIASRMGIKAYELDWRIWEYQRSIKEK